MDIQGNLLLTPVHQDDLRLYSSQDCTAFYNGRETLKIQELEDRNGDLNEDGLESNEGGVDIN